MPRLSQRRAPFTVLPMPGRNTASNSTTHSSNSNWLCCSTVFSSVRMAIAASTMPTARNTAWRLRKYHGPTSMPAPATAAEPTITTPKQASAIDTPSSHGSKRPSMSSTRVAWRLPPCEMLSKATALITPCPCSGRRDR